MRMDCPEQVRSIILPAAVLAGTRGPAEQQVSAGWGNPEAMGELWVGTTVIAAQAHLVRRGSVDRADYLAMEVGTMCPQVKYPGAAVVPAEAEVEEVEEAAQEVEAPAEVEAVAAPVSASLELVATEAQEAQEGMAVRAAWEAPVRLEHGVAPAAALWKSWRAAGS